MPSTRPGPAGRSRCSSPAGSSGARPARMRPAPRGRDPTLAEATGPYRGDRTGGTAPGVPAELRMGRESGLMATERGQGAVAGRRPQDFRHAWRDCSILPPARSLGCLAALTVQLRTPETRPRFEPFGQYAPNPIHLVRPSRHAARSRVARPAGRRGCAVPSWGTTRPGDRCFDCITRPWFGTSSGKGSDRSRMWRRTSGVEPCRASGAWLATRTKARSGGGSSPSPIIS